MTRNERELKAVEEEMVRHSKSIQAVWDKAEEDDRPTSDDERKDVEKHLKAVEQLKAQKREHEAALEVEADVKRVSNELGKKTPTEPVGAPRVLPGGDWQDRAIKSIGEVFTDSAGFTTVDEPVKKIATILPISEEMLEDAPAVQSYINGRLTLFVRIEEERQLLRGAGTNEIIGIMPTGNTRGINQYSGAGTATGGRAEILFKAMNGQRGSALIEPGFIVVSPADWEAIRLAKDTANQYYGGGPFQGPYGSGANVAASGQVTGAQDALWGKPVVVTGALGAGTALVGTSSAAQVWRKGGLSVEASNSHNDFFQRNLVAIRAEERLALSVYRPTAFTEVRFL